MTFTWVNCFNASVRNRYRKDEENLSWYQESCDSKNLFILDGQCAISLFDAQK